MDTFQLTDDFTAACLRFDVYRSAFLANTAQSIASPLPCLGSTVESRLLCFSYYKTIVPEHDNFLIP